MSKKNQKSGAPCKLKATTLPSGEVVSLALTALTKWSGTISFLQEAEWAREGDLWCAAARIEERLTEVSVFESVQSCALWRQALACVSKVSAEGNDTLTPAVDGWFEDEYALLETLPTRTRWLKSAVAERARLFCHFVLSESPTFKSGRHGPGSSSTVRGKYTGYFSKTKATDVSTSAIAPLAQALRYNPTMWREMGMDPLAMHRPVDSDGFLNLVANHFSHRVDCDAVIGVVKNWKTDRMIGIGPTWNIFLQLALGEQMFDLLLRNVHIDLRDQSKNQRLAAQGSRESEWHPDPLGTFDLRGASGRIAADLVRGIFPADWIEAMDSVRVNNYSIVGFTDARPYFMYSGMGNGFTFPMETIVFASVLFAVSELPLKEFVESNRWAVYGDDIVAPTSWLERFREAADLVGFRVNEEKSYIGSHPFRESCGGDFYRGVNVTPAYVRSYREKRGHTHMLQLVGFTNTAARSYLQLDVGAGARALFRKYISNYVPSSGSDDTGFNGAIYRTSKYSIPYQRPIGYHIRVIPEYRWDTDPNYWLIIGAALQGAKQSESLELSEDARATYTVEIRPDVDHHYGSKESQVWRLIRTLKAATRNEARWELSRAISTKTK